MGPKKDKKKKKTLSKRLAATNLSKKEIEAFINRSKAINQRQYSGVSRVSRISKADMKNHYADMRNYYSPVSKAPKTLNIPVGTSPKDFFLSEEAQRAKTVFAKLKEESAFKNKLREVELEEMKLVMEPTVFKLKENIYEKQHEQNIRHARYKNKVEKMHHEKVLLDLAASDQTAKNKYHADKVKNANAIANHLKRNGAPREVYKNGVKQYVYDDPNSLAKREHEKNLRKIAATELEQQQQFDLDKIKLMNKNNNNSRKIGGKIINQKGKTVETIVSKKSSLAQKKALDTAEENVKQLEHEYQEDKDQRDREFRKQKAEEKWRPLIDPITGIQRIDPNTGKTMWEGTGVKEKDVQAKEHEAIKMTFEANQLKLQNDLEQRLKVANAKVTDKVTLNDNSEYTNMIEF